MRTNHRALAPDSRKLSDNLRRWAEVYRSDGQEAEAKAL